MHRVSLQDSPTKSPRTLELLDLVRRILEQVYPATLRQCHYALVALALAFYSNDRCSYQRLSRITTEARRRYRQLQLNGHRLDPLPPDCLPDHWLIDELRRGERVSAWRDLHDFMNTVRQAYRRDLWQAQPWHIELWGEKGSLLGSLRPVTEEFGITLRALRGFGSCGAETEIGHSFEQIEKAIQIFYIGDFDPSGEVIERDMFHRVQAAACKTFEMTRLAILKQDITRFNLPPAAVKPSDSRSAAFERRHGSKPLCVEAEALPIQELRDRVRNAIQGLIDPDAWDVEAEAEQDDLKRLAKFIRRNNGGSAKARV